MSKRYCKNCRDRNWLIECACGCGGVLTRISPHREVRKFIHGHNIGKGDKCTFWKGGERYDGRYIRVKAPNNHPRPHKYGVVYKHILVFETYYKCCMLPWGNVHHIDEDKKNNDPKNLQGFTRGGHTTNHQTGKKRPPEVVEKIRQKLKGRKMKYMKN